MVGDHHNTNNYIKCLPHHLLPTSNEPQHPKSPNVHNFPSDMASENQYYLAIITQYRLHSLCNEKQTSKCVRQCTSRRKVPLEEKKDTTEEYVQKDEST